MQTFLPYPDFTKSAQCLDNKRLGKQRSNNNKTNTKMKLFYSIKTPARVTQGNYCTLEQAKRSIILSYSKVGEAAFDESMPERVVATTSNGDRFTIEPEFLYNSVQHL